MVRRTVRTLLYVQVGLPLLGYSGYDEALYRRTRARILSAEHNKCAGAKRAALGASGLSAARAAVGETLPLG